LMKKAVPQTRAGSRNADTIICRIQFLPPILEPRFWFLKYFRRKNWRFLLNTLLNYAKHWIMTIGFKINAIFFAENGQKSQKIVIITSIPGVNVVIKISQFSLFLQFSFIIFLFKNAVSISSQNGQFFDKNVYVRITLFGYLA
jgi:hypothetical protein